MTLILLILGLIFATMAVPLVRKQSFELSEKEYELLKKAVEDAINHVHQLANAKNSKEYSSEEKKQIATQVASTIAETLGVSLGKRELISSLIESTLWAQAETVEDEVDTYD